MSGVIDVVKKQNKDSINKPRNGLGTYALIQMGESMSENSKRVVFMGEASIPGRMDVFTLENSKTAKGMVREP